MMTATKTEKLTETDATELAKRYQSGFDCHVAREGTISLAGYIEWDNRWAFWIDTNNGKRPITITVSEDIRKVWSDYVEGSMAF